MKLATLDNQTRDGELLVVSSDNQRYQRAGDIAATLQQALDDWSDVAPRLHDLAAQMNSDAGAGTALDAETQQRLLSPLPRAYEWVDASAYINHIVLVRKARGAEPPPTLREDPLVYQGGSGCLLSPTAHIEIIDPDFGYDFEAEICVVLADTPQGVGSDRAADYVRLFMLANDVSLRNLIPAELQKGFGFFVSKPASAFAPLAVTADELGDCWRGGRVHLPLITKLNDKQFGNPDAGKEMHFSFHDLIAHITKTRAFTAGTILGSGTVSNADPTRGSSCLQEQRVLEKIAHGTIKTPFLQDGDRLEIHMLDAQGRSIFGKIAQTCRRV